MIFSIMTLYSDVTWQLTFFYHEDLEFLVNFSLILWKCAQTVTKQIL
jgi:hypothetical protein